MVRPTGVTVIAVLAFIGAGLLTILGILAFVGGAFIGAMIGSGVQAQGSGPAGAGLGAMIGGVIGVFFLIFAAVQLTCGVGLWKLKEWGRLLTIIVSAIGIVLALFNLMHFHVFALFFVMIRIAIGGLIIWYLSQPQVKAAFMTPVLPYAAR